MKFTSFQYVPAFQLGKMVLKTMHDRIPIQYRDQVAQIYSISDAWEAQRKPFYRLYPGYIETVERIDFTRFPWKVTLPLSPIAFEFPASLDYFVQTQSTDGWETSFKVEAVIVQAHEAGFSGVAYGQERGEYTNLLIPDLLQNDQNGKMGFIGRLVLGIQLVIEEPDLFKPVLLRRDEGKPARPELVARAIRNGVYGFDVGEALPTREEIEEMKRAGTFHEGEKSPHFRTSYFGLRWTGPNRKTPKIVRIKECLVGFKKIQTIPTGFYD